MEAKGRECFEKQAMMGHVLCWWEAREDKLEIWLILVWDKDTVLLRPLDSLLHHDLPSLSSLWIMQVV